MASGICYSYLILGPKNCVFSTLLNRRGCGIFPAWILLEQQLIFEFCNERTGLKTLRKLPDHVCSHLWPPPSITLDHCGENPSLAAALSILLMPCRHTAKSPFSPSKPWLSLRFSKNRIFCLKNKANLSLQTFPPLVSILCSSGDFGSCLH